MLAGGGSSTFKVKLVWVVNGITLDIVAFFRTFLVRFGLAIARCGVVAFTLSQGVGAFAIVSAFFLLAAFVGCDGCSKMPSSGLGCRVCNDPREVQSASRRLGAFSIVTSFFLLITSVF